MSSLAMRVPPRLLAVVGFVAVGILALIVAGLLDWIVGVLFLTMEFLGEVVRGVFRDRKARRSHLSRVRPLASRAPFEVGPRLRSGRRQAPRRRVPGRDRLPLDTASDSGRPSRVLLPLSGHEPDLVAFALEECRARRAELLVLFIRSVAVIPMGPNPWPEFSEDEEARFLLDRVETQAVRASIPIRTLYEATNDRPSTISRVAVVQGVDVVMVGATRQGAIARYLKGDSTPSLLRLLPSRTSLLVRAC